MKTKILMSVLVIVVAISMVVSVTMAWFTDAETNTGNTFTSGTIKLDVNQNGSDGQFSIALGSIGNLAPGDITVPATITVKNDGTLDAATFGKFTVSDETGNLSQYFDFYEYKVQYFDASGNSKARWTTHDPYWGSANNEDYFIHNGVWGGGAGFSTKLSAWAAGTDNLDGVGAWDAEALKPGEYYTLTFQLKFNENAGNELQGKTFNLGFDTEASQPTLGAVNSLGNIPNAAGIMSYLRVTQLGYAN